MLTSLTVKNYRGFRDLTIDGLTQINLIAGQSNTGKTSLLEAVGLLIDPSLNVFEAIHRNRGILEQRNHFLELTKWMYHNGASKAPINIMGQFDDRLDRDIALEIISNAGLEQNDFPLFSKFSNQYPQIAWKDIIKVTLLNGGEDPRALVVVPHSMGLIATAPHPVGPLRFITSSGTEPLLIDDFSRLLIEQRMHEFIETLRFADPRLRNLDLATFCGESQIYANLGIGRLVPTALMGEGFRRLMTFVFAIANCSKGVVLIDEIENGLHHSIMEKIWRAIGEAARTANCQVFATTHSYECIQAAQKAFFDNGENDLTLIRLERDGETIRPIIISEESLATAMQFDWEIR